MDSASKEAQRAGCQVSNSFYHGKRQRKWGFVVVVVFPCMDHLVLFGQRCTVQFNFYLTLDLFLSWFHYIKTDLAVKKRILFFYFI